MRRLSLALAILLPLFLAACDSSEDRAEAYYQSALSLLEEGDRDRAIVELLNVFQLNGSHFEARSLLASLHLEKGEISAAYGQYLRLAEQYPNDLETRVILSQLAFQAGNWDELERHGLKAEEIAPANADVQILTLARAYRAAALDDDGPAREALRMQAEELLVTNPDEVILRNILIDHDLSNQRFTSALTQLEWLLEQDPKNQVYLNQRLQVLLQLGDEDAVEEQLIAMIALFPEDDDSKATLLRFYLSRGDVDAAEQYLRDLADLAGPDEAGQAVDLIRFLLEVRGPEAAYAEIEKGIAEKTDPIPFRVLGAGLDFESGKQEAALATMEDIISTGTDPEQLDPIRVAAARMFLETGNEVRARALIEETLASDPGQPEALKMQASWLIEADETDSAIISLRNALDRNPEDAQAMTLLATAYARSGSLDLSRDFLSLAVEASGNAPAESARYAQVLISEERYLPAEDVLLPSLRLNPNNEQLLTLLGRLYLAMEDQPRAEQVVATLRRIDTESAKAAAIQIETLRLNQTGGTAEAMAYLESIANAADASIGSQYMLLRGQLASGDTSAALNLANRLVAENPDDLNALAALAATKSAANDLEGAEEVYQTMLELSNSDPAIVLELVRLKNRMGDQEEARGEVKAALETNPDDPRLLWAEASYLEREGEIDAAIAVYEELYTRDSGSFIVANNLASLLTTHRTDDESLERAWSIARRFKEAEIPQLLDTYGWIQHRRGDSADAVDALERAATGLPNDALVQYHFAEALFATDRKDEALEQYRRAIQVAGEIDTRPQIEAARSRIAELEAAEQSE